MAQIKAIRPTKGTDPPPLWLPIEQGPFTVWRTHYDLLVWSDLSWTRNATATIEDCVSERDPL